MRRLSSHRSTKQDGQIETKINKFHGVLLLSRPRQTLVSNQSSAQLDVYFLAKGKE